MKICYVPRKFQAKRQILIDQANSIIDEYQQQGYELTIRQIYYQFVSRGLLPNTPKSYNDLGSAINKARLAGLVDWEAIVDRTRNTDENQHWDSPREIIEACAYSYKIDTRKTQPIYVEVWIEKEALAGVIEKTCRSLDVLSFACRGYVSQSAMWEASQRMLKEENEGKKTIILHLGDHDPSGIDMTRDIQDRLDLFRTHVTVKRIALTMKQINRYEPPPNPAKLSDSRCQDYIRNYGEESWELDALEPKVIDSLIVKHINQLTDFDLLEESEKLQESGKETLREIAANL